MSIRSRFGAAWLGFKNANWVMKLGTMAELLGEAFSARSKTGKAVNEDTALDLTTVMAVVMRIAYGVAQVPWKVFEYLPNEEGKKEAREHPLWRLLHRKPNDWQTSFAFRVTMMLHLLLAKRFVAFVNRVDDKIVEILPLAPRRVEVRRARGGYDLEFFLTGDDGSRRQIPAESIWYLPGPSWDGWDGIDFVKHARDAIGLAFAAEENQIEQQKRGSRIPGVLALEGNVKTTDYADLSKWVREQTQKDIAETGVMMVDRSGKFYPTSMTGVAAQTLETRRYQAEEICRHWGLLPVMIGLGEKAQAYASVEQMMIAHVVHTLDPWYVCIEQSAETSLLSREEQDTFSISFIRAGLMRGSMREQFDSFAIALGRGATAPGQAWMSPNEVRGLLEMNRIDGGDKLSEPTPAAAVTPPKKPGDA